MKKFYSILGLAVLGTLLSAKADAQITLSSSDMPAVGNKFVNAFDTLTSSVSRLTPGGSGASVTWNYNFVPLNYSSTDSIVTPSSTPYSASFPGATVADTTFGTQGYTYFDGTSSVFSVVGSEQNVMGFMVAVKFNPNYLQLNLPGIYKNTDGGTSTAHVPPQAFSYTGIDSVKATIIITYVDTIDAYGSLTTPYNTYQTLRQKHKETDVDSLYVHSTVAHAWVFYQKQLTKSYEYRWYTNGIGDMAAMMTLDSTDTKVKSFQWYNALVTGVNEISQAHSTTVYPNPSSTQVNFRFSANQTLNVAVYDVTGRQLGQTEMKNGLATLNTSTFSTGMYLYHVIDQSGNVLDNGKFSVQR